MVRTIYCAPFLYSLFFQCFSSLTYDDACASAHTCSVHAATGDVNPLKDDRLVTANVAAMGPMDKVALAFAAYMVALPMVAELKDITLVSIAVQQAGDNLSPNMRRAFTMLNGIRRWLFLPALLATVPTLVLIVGGDALKVCMNTVALMFCEKSHE